MEDSNVLKLQEKNGIQVEKRKVQVVKDAKQSKLFFKLCAYVFFAHLGHHRWRKVTGTWRIVIFLM